MPRVFSRVTIRSAVVCCAPLLILASHASAQPQQPRFFGLTLATPQQMLGIPLASLPFSGTELPRAINLAADLPPPGEQGGQNSCVAWSLAYALKSYHEHVEERWSLRDAFDQPNLASLFSPSFLYNQINDGRDGGSYPNIL